MALAPDAPSFDQIRHAPNVLLHDHLDGRLRPSTVVEFARDRGYDGLPTDDPGEFAVWFTRGALRRDLELVVGFDIAGAEAGYPPSRHLDAFQLVMREGFRITINAMKSAFWPFEQRLRIINEQIKPGYAALRASAL